MGVFNNVLARHPRLRERDLTRRLAEVLDAAYRFRRSNEPVTEETARDAAVLFEAAAELAASLVSVDDKERTERFVLIRSSLPPPSEGGG
jgi:hypothetical protein